MTNPSLRPAHRRISKFINRSVLQRDFHHPDESTSCSTSSDEGSHNNPFEQALHYLRRPRRHSYSGHSPPRFEVLSRKRPLRNPDNRLPKHANLFTGFPSAATSAVPSAVPSRVPSPTRKPSRSNLRQMVGQRELSQRRRSIHFDEMVRSLESGGNEGRLRGCGRAEEREEMGMLKMGGGSMGERMGNDGSSDCGAKEESQRDIEDEEAGYKEETPQQLSPTGSWRACTTAVNSRSSSIRRTNTSNHFPLLKPIRDCKLRLAEVCLEIARLSRELTDPQHTEASGDAPSDTTGHKARLEKVSEQLEKLKRERKSRIMTLIEHYQKDGGIQCGKGSNGARPMQSSITPSSISCLSPSVPLPLQTNLAYPFDPSLFSSSSLLQSPQILHFERIHNRIRIFLSALSPLPFPELTPQPGVIRPRIFPPRPYNLHSPPSSINNSNEPTRFSPQPRKVFSSSNDIRHPTRLHTNRRGPIRVRVRFTVEVWLPVEIVKHAHRMENNLNMNRAPRTNFSDEMWTKALDVEVLRIVEREMERRGMVMEILVEGEERRRRRGKRREKRVEKRAAGSIAENEVVVEG